MLLVHSCQCLCKIPLLCLFFEKTISFLICLYVQFFWRKSLSFLTMNFFKSYTSSRDASFIPGSFLGENLSVQTSSKQYDMICEPMALHKQIHLPSLSLIWKIHRQKNRAWFENFYFCIEWGSCCGRVDLIYISFKTIMED